MRLLFVCLGNICRSPAGENVMRQLVEKAGLESEIACNSAGTAGWHVGKSPDARMTACLARRSIANPGSAAKLSLEMMASHDLILAMDQQNYEDILARDPEGLYHDRVRKFTDFCTEHDHQDVPDPYYGGSDGFEEVADLMLDGCTEILRQIQAGELKKR